MRLITRAERLAALCAALAAGPVMIVIAITIAVLSRGCPLVRHVRVGWRGSKLGMLKFRTMWEAGSRRAPLFRIPEVRDYVPVSKLDHDPRVTSTFAAWCRRHSLDELPQLFHVIRGEMSFVGPRPITRHELDTHYGDCAEKVLSVRPGLTGLWQIMGRSRLTYARRRRLDLLLVRRASARLYIHILVKSIPAVFRGADAH